jgi:hypothetical protein
LRKLKNPDIERAHHWQKRHLVSAILYFFFPLLLCVYTDWSEMEVRHTNLAKRSAQDISIAALLKESDSFSDAAKVLYDKTGLRLVIRNRVAQPPPRRRPVVEIATGNSLEIVADEEHGFYRVELDDSVAFVSFDEETGCEFLLPD